MQKDQCAVLDNQFLTALADLLMQAGRDSAADVIYAAIEAEMIQHEAIAPTTSRARLRLVHSSELDSDDVHAF